MWRICGLLVVLGLAGCAVFGSPSTPVAPHAAGLVAGDRLRIQVAGEDELTGLFVVDGAGDVAMPLLGKVHAAGLEVSAFAETLRVRLKAGYLKQPEVTVARADTVPQLAGMPPPLRPSEALMEVP
jgi:protein involved in polysaccharide export with SLBB domain